MNVINVADTCRTAILENGAVDWNIFTTDYNLSVGHIIAMCDKIISEEITGEKAHRWLGWIQACMCMGNVANLDQLKQINHEN